MKNISFLSRFIVCLLCNLQGEDSYKVNDLIKVRTTKQNESGKYEKWVLVEIFMTKNGRRLLKD